MKLHLVFYEPEIGGNVGALLRTAVALEAEVHLIQPFGFFLDDRFVKRASANYIKDAVYHVYDDYADFVTKLRNPMVYYATRYARKTYSTFDFKKTMNQQEAIYLMVGRESTGIPKDILRAHPENCMRIPMGENARSLNVTISAAIISYEIMRQWNYPSLLEYDHFKNIKI